MDSGRKKGRTSESDADVDRLSALPNDILTHILSRLPTDEAVRTSRLSKRWSRVCFTVPAVDISKKPAVAVTKYLLSRDADAGILSFRVAEFSTPPADTAIDQWMATALAGNLETLHLNLDLEAAHYFAPTLCPSCVPDYPNTAANFGSFPKLYSVPPHLFAQATLRHLRLRDCVLLLPQQTLSFSLGLLETLSLQRIAAPQDRIQCLISACHRLTELTLEECPTLKDIMVQPRSHLFRAFTMRCCHTAEKVAVDAPSLQFLEYKGRLLDVDNPLSVTNWGELQVLSIDICDGHLPGLHKIVDILKITSKLKVLTVGKTSPTDDTTLSGEVPQDLQSITDIECLNNTLSMIHIVGYDEQPGLQRMTRFLLSKAIVLEKIHVSFSKAVEEGSATEAMLRAQITQMNPRLLMKKIVFTCG